jgi:hypothetical protein
MTGSANSGGSLVSVRVPGSVPALSPVSQGRRSPIDVEEPDDAPPCPRCPRCPRFQWEGPADKSGRDNGEDN